MDPLAPTFLRFTHWRRKSRRAFNVSPQDVAIAQTRLSLCPRKALIRQPKRAATCGSTNAKERSSPSSSKGTGGVPYLVPRYSLSMSRHVFTSQFRQGLKAFRRFTYLSYGCFLGALGHIRTPYDQPDSRSYSRIRSPRTYIRGGVWVICEQDGHCKFRQLATN